VLQHHVSQSREGVRKERRTLASRSPESLMQFGLTIRPFVASQTLINGRQPHGTSTRRLMFSLLIKSLVAGIDLIELRSSKPNHSV
jgi:hypothetical protein